MKTIEYYHKNSEVLAYKKTFISENFWYERTYDENGNILTFKDSSDCWAEKTYNEKGEELTFKNSNGVYMIKDKAVTKEEFENFQNKPCLEKTVTIDEHKPKTYTRDEIISITNNMHRYGGCFMKALSECINRADHENLVKLQSVFEDDFEKYLKF